ncbi:hypothetical protein C8J55DRAFT_559677 [Lentinula edodes]|uniref:AB hydrolase-1 domain-containing protein n=1 Tax=Lentinula lateritia TaxID=40482 RepID=A0A9W9DRD1_9AGAR|nr:hypothetical protein C8J55DRAFT_559677 [Lentinula edodes]
MPLQIQTYTLSEGIELSFTDSGVPPGSADYTTVVFLHGGIFNAYQFHKVHAHAHAQNLRTVLLHRRDYAGSTSYSATEIEELEQGSVTFWERLSAQVAQFLEIFIERERIPKLTRKLSSSRETTCSFAATSVKENRGGNGGIAILAWSAGCSTVLSFLGGTQNPLISKELYQLLQQYVGNCILYGQRFILFFKARLTKRHVPKDPTYLCFGYPLPSDNRNYIPWDDLTVSTDELPQLVAEWVSSYYDHPCYDPVTRSLPSTATVNELDGIRLKSDRISISSWTDEELVKGLEGSSAKNETLVFQPSVQKILRQLSEQALFNETSVSNWFPGVGVSYIGGTRSNWMCAWAIIETKRRYLRTLFTGIEKNGRSYNIRKIRFVDMDGLNHVAHWDQTREFMEVIAKEIQLL